MDEFYFDDSWWVDLYNEEFEDETSYDEEFIEDWHEEDYGLYWNDYDDLDDYFESDLLREIVEHEDFSDIFYFGGDEVLDFSEFIDDEFVDEDVLISASREFSEE